MSFDWNKSAEGGNQAGKIPAGENIAVSIERVIYGKKGGASFKSKGGDPQIMVIFIDDDGNEAGQMVTLSEKAGWVLARLLKRFGADIDGLSAQGMTPANFAHKAVADRYLVGLSGHVNITYDANGYADVEPCENGASPKREQSGYAEPPEQVPAATRKPTPVVPGEYVPIDESDLPF